MRKTPTKYQAPLQSRAAITDWITDWEHNSGHYKPRSWQDGTYFFCFNVKLGFIDLSFASLLEKYNTATEGMDPNRIEAAKARYIELYDDLKGNGDKLGSLFESSQEGAIADFAGRPYVLFNGTEVDCEFRMMGRSAGWMVLTKFEGVDLNGFEGVDLNGFEEKEIAEMSYAELRLLYKLLVHLSADLGGNEPEKLVLWHAASYFFEVLAEKPDNVAAI